MVTAIARQSQPQPAGPNPADVLRALADLAPQGRQGNLDVATRGRTFAWLGDPTYADAHWLASRLTIRATRELRRAAAVDELNRDERLLRQGWLFVAGAIDLDDKSTRVCLPLLSRPIRLRVKASTVNISPAGDLDIISLARDAGEVAALEADLTPATQSDDRWGFDATQVHADRDQALKEWIHRAIAAAGLPAAAIHPDPRVDPGTLTGDGLLVVLGTGIYSARDLIPIDRSAVLRAWAERPGIDHTAFAHMTRPPTPADRSDDTSSVQSALQLSVTQERAVRRSRTTPVLAISGAPGTGKSHTAAALALDAVSRNESVLIATQSVHAADVLAQLLSRFPGPDPVLFGDVERRELSSALEVADVDHRELAATTERASAAESVRTSAIDRIRLALELEASVELAQTNTARSDELRRLAPGAFGARDYRHLHTLLERANPQRPLLVLGSWRRRRALARLSTTVGASTGAGYEQLVEAVEVGDVARLAHELEQRGGTRLGEAWRRLAQTDADYRQALGRAREADVAGRAARNGSGRLAVGELATALRSGRAKRRMTLERLDGPALLAALPLWLGTLRDIEDLLPPRPGLFDVVILDEASQVDQFSAAPALLRAKRAVIVGDPKQLRHVSFVADLAITETRGRHDLDDLPGDLDVRGNSAFDIAAIVGPTIRLDDHFRSWPHLIVFSARRFYDRRLMVMTRHPRTESHDAIDLIRVDGHRDDAGVNTKEIELILGLIRDEAGADRSVGVLTPFRAQADAIERAIIDSISLEEIERLRLASGTVHGFQGSERDLVIASVAVDPTATGLTFLNNPNLFNVMVTRAREQMVVVTSVGDAATGLLADYLEHEARPPIPRPTGSADTEWIASLETEFARAGVTARTSYPVGPWMVDLVVGDGSEAIGLECRVHPDGPEAHIRRHRELERAGWQLADAYPTAYRRDAALAVVELTTELDLTSGAAT